MVELSKNMKRSARVAARLGLVSSKIIVRSDDSPSSTLSMASRDSGSRFVNGSSSTRICGFKASDAAMTRRCCSPPERLNGLRSNKWPRLVASTAKSTRLRISWAGRPKFSGPNAISSSTVKARPERCWTGICPTSCIAEARSELE